MSFESGSSGHILVDVLDRVLDKGIVIDAAVRISVAGIELLGVDARVVVASIETYLLHADTLAYTDLAAGSKRAPSSADPEGASAWPSVPPELNASAPRALNPALPPLYVIPAVPEAPDAPTATTEPPATAAPADTVRLVPDQDSGSSNSLAAAPGEADPGRHVSESPPDTGKPLEDI